MQDSIQKKPRHRLHVRPNIPPTGYRCVYPYNNGRYRVSVTHEYKRHWFGPFDSVEEAVQVRDDFIKKIEAGQ